MSPEVLAATRCFFGGGTRIVLELQEYRESADVDFLCSDRAGYRTIRSMVTQDSFGELFRDDGDAVQRELTAALARFEEPAYRKRCTTALAVRDLRQMNRGLAKLRRR